MNINVERDPSQPPKTPRDYLRARRPERYSDSTYENESELDRSFLEYHLDTITSRNQERAFENFAKALLEREVCPNLRPQTGPVGGGDSKADTETIPVAESISEAWYFGAGSDKERWAFAFSAKKAWTSKARSDIDGMAETGRGYEKLFFVTNQFARDKTRAAIEDELGKKHGVQVTILDRTWILDCVFGNGHEDIAVAELGIGAQRAKKRVGPKDLQRERELEEVEQRIKDALAAGRHTSAVVDDCLTAAALARNLDKPRTAVDGRYERAHRLAKKVGRTHQEIQALYQKAWSSYFWFNDGQSVCDLYDGVEELVLGRSNVYEFELLFNLLNLMAKGISTGWVPTESADLEARRHRFAARLRELAEDENRPSSALQARAMLAFHDYLWSNPPDFSALYRELQEIIEQCPGLVGFPLEPLVDIITELGDLAPEVAEYDSLFESLTSVVGDRKRGHEVAALLVRRAHQHMQAERPVEAIRAIGRALTQLATHESRDSLVRALYVLGAAYEAVGMLWAARGAMMTAASLSANDLWVYGETTPAQMLCMRRLYRIELRLGRIPQFFCYRQLYYLLRADRGLHEFSEEDSEEFWLTDAVLGIALLRGSRDDLGQLTRLPKALETLGLELSALALRYALGDNDAFPTELTESRSAADFAMTWATQPAANRLGSRLELGHGGTVEYQTRIAGCLVTLSTTRDGTCAGMAELVLAAIEGLLAVGLADGVIAREPTLTIRMNVASGETSTPLSFALSHEAGRPVVDVECGSVALWHPTRESRDELPRLLFELAADILAHAFVMKDTESLLSQWFEEDDALGRVFGFSVGLGALGNIFGSPEGYKDAISDWIPDDAAECPLERDPLLVELIDAAPSTTTSSLEPGVGDVPAELRDWTRISHSDLHMTSVIRQAIWDEAGWMGVAWIGGGGITPIMALIFTNPEAGQQIVDLWRREFGEVDSKEALRISVVRGINRSRPHDYRVIVGSNVDSALQHGNTHAIVTARIHEMNPDSGKNLERFLEDFRAAGEYRITCAYLPPGAPEPAVYWDGAITKSQLVVKHASQVGPHDPEISGVRDDDDIEPSPSKVRDAGKKKRQKKRKDSRNARKRNRKKK